MFIVEKLHLFFGGDFGTKGKGFLEVSNGDIGSAFNYLCSLFCLASYKHMDLGNFYVTYNSNMNM
jgi:hypothetical protein